MNTDLILMLGALILLAISGLLVFCFTESKGRNTPHARRMENDKQMKNKAKNHVKQHVSSQKMATHHMSVIEMNK